MSFTLAVVLPCAGQTFDTAAAKGHDFVIKEIRFNSGATLAELNIRYRTIGIPCRDAAGRVENAVLLLHSSTRDGTQFLAPTFAGELFEPDQPLDVRRFYIILPDAIGHGGSAKPSDELRIRFPNYDYDDMVEATRRLRLEDIQVEHLRLLLGTSMGCMHTLYFCRKISRFRACHIAAGMPSDAAIRAQPNLA